MILGTYHMENPERDLGNVNADDVRSEKRQKEAGNDYAAADLVRDWYERNLKICANIARLAESPNERVFVIIGADI